jgi:hypothetical protein
MNFRDAILVTSGLGALLWLRRPSHYSFKDKVVVITGGSRGLGLALAREFARHEAKLALLARDPTNSSVPRPTCALPALSLRHGRQTSGKSRTSCDPYQQSRRNRPHRCAHQQCWRDSYRSLEAMTDEDFEQAMAVHF